MMPYYVFQNFLKGEKMNEETFDITKLTLGALKERRELEIELEIVNEKLRVAKEGLEKISKWGKYSNFNPANLATNYLVVIEKIIK